jgi:hypothetical protein
MRLAERAELMADYQRKQAIAADAARADNVIAFPKRPA